MSVSFLKKILIILVIAVLAMCVLYYFMYSFLQGKDTRISERQSELLIQTKNKEYMSSIKSIIADNGNDIDRVKQSVLPTDQDAVFIESIENLGRDNNLSIGIDSLIFEDDPVLLEKGLHILKVRIRTKGTWVRSYRFIAQLQGMQYAIKIDRIALSRAMDEGDSKKISASNNLWQSMIDIQVLKYK